MKRNKPRTDYVTSHSPKEFGKLYPNEAKFLVDTLPFVFAIAKKNNVSVAFSNPEKTMTYITDGKEIHAFLNEVSNE